MIECVTASCRTMVNDSAKGINMDGSARRNTICGRCLRLSKENKIKNTVVEVKPKNINRFRRARGVFIRDCSNGSTQYIKIGEVDKMGIIHLFKGAI